MTIVAVVLVLLNGCATIDLINRFKIDTRRNSQNYV